MSKRTRLGLERASVSLWIILALLMRVSNQMDCEIAGFGQTLLRFLIVQKIVHTYSPFERSSSQ